MSPKVQLVITRGTKFTTSLRGAQRRGNLLKVYATSNRLPRYARNDRKVFARGNIRKKGRNNEEWIRIYRN